MCFVRLTDPMNLLFEREEFENTVKFSTVYLEQTA